MPGLWALLHRHGMRGFGLYLAVTYLSGMALLGLVEGALLGVPAAWVLMLLLGPPCFGLLLFPLVLLWWTVTFLPLARRVGHTVRPLLAAVTGGLGAGLATLIWFLLAPYPWLGSGLPVVLGGATWGWYTARGGA